MWLSGRLGKEVLQEIEKQTEMLGVRQASLRYTDDEMVVKDWREAYWRRKTSAWEKKWAGGGC
jgi:hypothetical protein